MSNFDTDNTNVIVKRITFRELVDVLKQASEEFLRRPVGVPIHCYS